MCATCGCSDESGVRIVDLEAHSGHDHSHPHDGNHSHPPHGDHDHSHDHGSGAHPPHDNSHHDHDHDHPHDGAAGVYATVDSRPTPRTIRLEQEVLAANQRLAERNRGWLEGRGVVAWNLMSSPGAGKTTLLERTLRDLGGEVAISVIEGDQATARDAERIRAAGARVVQINTGSGCHLDAGMLAAALRRLDPPARSLVMIENVGNLVCPALFDLGESLRAVVMSVTEGEDKPLKYPHMFRAANLLVLNKIDLLPHLEFDVEACLAGVRRVNPRLEILRVSATRGDGLEGWYARLRNALSVSVEAPRG
jgi:hydrogenase nickel incorporation protein HypB